MKIVAIERFGDFDMAYQELYKGSEESPEASVVMAELNAINHPAYPSSEQDKLYSEMKKIVRSHGYTRFNPLTVTISD